MQCVHTPSLTKEASLLVSDYLDFFKKYRSHHFDVCDHEEDCHDADGCQPEEEELAAG